VFSRQDPEAKKPEDWDEREQIPDPADEKPAGYDDIPATIPDAEATKPEDWDEEEDGTWSAPEVANPEYKGEWTPKMIDNPAYKGIWTAPDIDNPDYKHSDTLYQFTDSKFVGFELWQVKAGTIFDNIIVTDDVAAATTFAEETWAKTKDAEKAAFDKVKEEEKAATPPADELPTGGDSKPAAEEEEDDEDDYDEPKPEL
jgi:calreticulin